MIVIEIDEEAGVSHFEVLGLQPAELNGLDDKAQTVKVTNAAKHQQKKYQKKAQLNDKSAEATLQRINQAATVLKVPETRRKYIEELGAGKAGTPEVLRAGYTAPLFFRDRAARFRTIEEALQDMERNGSRW